MAGLSSRLARLNPFSDTVKAPKGDDAEDLGEELDADSKAGGGFTGIQASAGIQKLHVSPALKSFLVHHNVLSQQEPGLEDAKILSDGIQALLDKVLVKIPPEVTDRSYPLPSYFVSSSHNTYLTAHQLYGSASPEAYKTALEAGSRCIEIDAWDGDDVDEPKVTHGYTLTSHISFRSVCEAIRDFVDKEATVSAERSDYQSAPILLSLENHCGPSGQQRLVVIMKEVFQDRLLSKAAREKGSREQEGTGEHVSLAELGSKVAVIVEYHFPGEPESDDDASSSDSGGDEKARKERKEYEKKKKETAAVTIVPELAELGIYAQSVKPPDNLWFEEGQLRDSPHHPLINLSETGLAAHMPQHNENISRHNANHLMRVYPKGTRISSRNLKPVPYWGIGAQICALNWQTFGASMQLNEALFAGTAGYVLKPESLRNPAVAGAPRETKRKQRLRLHVAGATDVPVSADREADSIKPYLTCSLVHPDDLANEPPKKKTPVYKPHKLPFLHQSVRDSPLKDPVWDEVLVWEYDENELIFLRLLIKSDDAFARNPVLAVNAVRLSYVAKGEWRFIRMLDLKGHETTCSLLLKFDFENA